MKKKTNKKEEPKKKVVKKKVVAKEQPQPIKSPFQPEHIATPPKVNFVNMTGEEVPPEIKAALDEFVKKVQGTGKGFVAGSISNSKAHGTRGDMKFDFDAGNKGLSGIAKMLDSYVNDFDCGNPDCPVHGGKNNVPRPMGEAKFNQKVEMMRRITKRESQGFIVMGEAMKNSKGLDVRGTDFINKMSKTAVIASVANGLKISSEELHEIADVLDEIVTSKDRDEDEE